MFCIPEAFTLTETRVAMLPSPPRGPRVAWREMADSLEDAESSVGISEFIGQHGQSLVASVKQHPEDFMVIELTTAGPVPGIPRGQELQIPARLKGTATAAEYNPAKPTGHPLEAALNLLDPSCLPTQPPAALRDVIGDELTASIWNWLQNNKDDLLNAPAHVLPSPPSKEARADMHTAILSLCPALRTQTTGPDSISISGRPVAAQLLPLLGMTGTHALLHFSAIKPRGTSTNEDASCELIATREARTQLHHLLRCEPTFKQLQAETQSRKRKRADGSSVRAPDEGELEPVVVVRWRQPGSGGKGKGRGRGTGRGRGPSGAPDGATSSDGAPGGQARSYLHMVLEKRNVELNTAARILARAFGVAPSCITYAGTKDARAVTRQRLCASDVSAEEAAAAAPQLEAQGLRIGHLQYAERQLHLGEGLAGNEFSIVLRELRPRAQQQQCDPAAPANGGTDVAAASTTEPRLALELAVRTLGESGFVNYFGMQRFGGHGAEVGRHILRDDFESALDVMVGAPRAEEPAELGAVRAHWKDSARNVQSTLRMASAVPGGAARLGEEMALLRGFERSGSARAAFSSLTWQKRQLYISAYVSALWNGLATLRLQHHGQACAVAGDDLLPLTSTAGHVPTLNELASFDAVADEDESIDADEKSSVEDAARQEAVAKVAEGSSESVASSNMSKDTAVGSQRVARGGEPLGTVGVLLPCSTASYAIPELQKAMLMRLAADGIQQSALPRRRKWRALVVTPASVQLEWQQQEEEGEHKGALASTCSPAACVRFALPPSSYATMALRQLLRCPSTVLQSWQHEAAGGS